MKRRKKLEIAIILGLLLSQGMYGNAWAENLSGFATLNQDYYYNTDSEYEVTGTITIRNGHIVEFGTEGDNNPVNQVILNGENGSAVTAMTGGGKLVVNANEAVIVTSNSNYSAALSAGYDGTEYNLSAGTISISGNNGGSAILIGSSSAVNNKIDITAKGDADTEVDTIVNTLTSKNSRATVDVQAGITNITAEKGSNYIENTNNYGRGLYITTGAAQINVTAENGKNIIETGYNAVETNADGATISLKALSNEIKSTNSGAAGVYVNSSDDSKVIITATGDYAEGYGYNKIVGGQTGVFVANSPKEEFSEVILEATGKNIISQTESSASTMAAGVYVAHRGKLSMTARENEITAVNEGVEGYLQSDITITATDGNNVINAERSGIMANMSYSDDDYMSNIKLIAEKGNNIVQAGKDANNPFGIFARFNSEVTLQAQNNIIEAAAVDSNRYGSGIAIATGLGSGNFGNDTTVTLAAKEQNYLSGLVRAEAATTVNLKGLADAGSNQADVDNIIRSSYVDSNGLLAVYGYDDAVINIDAGSSKDRYNLIRTMSDTFDANNGIERTVWAQRGANININGLSYIFAQNSGVSAAETEIDLDALDGNSTGIAITAGTGDANELDGYIQDGKLPDVADADRSTVNVNYLGNSGIIGDIVSGFGGLVNVISKEADGNLYLSGNVLAANGGIANIELGVNGTWYGRADDYGDADDGHTTFFNPAFSSQIIDNGEVNLTMGDNSTWFVQGQSWITSIDATDAVNTTIDLVSANTDRNATAHALTIGELKGDTTFHMSLNGDRSVSDMVYIKEAHNGEYLVNLADAVTTAEMYSDGVNDFTGLRFATIGSGDATFRAVTYDAGFENIEYLIDQDDYATSNENSHYNSADGSGDSDKQKPGDDSVDNLFSDSTAGLNATNYKLVGRKGEDLSDAGKTVLNMSRANYSNAVYMDRLNKRLGEARYINDEEDEGMWVRIRHDRIGKTDAYRSQNTMYELGYDEKQECDNGKRRVGFALDYMHGDTGYDNIAGKGEIDRYGVWLYDTWLGDKGHYADYVAKWGHLENDFEIYAPTTGEKITGDYCNNVLSISAEYGRKKDMGKDWYIEPQAQLQFAHVTDAGYTTSQNTAVQVDSINSLIGRLGFRLGKDFGEEKRSTVYVKADILHEFLGDQDIHAMDRTTNGNWTTVSYENKGTWYDVGFGYAAMLNKDSYAFIDLERSFGHDNDETYQINAGVQWSF